MPTSPPARPGWPFRLGIALLYTAGIAILSLTPDRSDPGGSTFVWLVHITPSTLQKSLHVVFYAGLACLWVWTIRAPAAIRLGAGFCIAVATGALLEWLQIYVPGRFGSLLDVIINTVGALVGVAVGRKVVSVAPTGRAANNRD